ncbi:MAG TPA: DUF2911 domain-containing protein [Terriglobia bacterium]|jgi:hypothetical protein|nr:DUF2911 domain-containing protein [Terriglobia bacterium]
MRRRTVLILAGLGGALTLAVAGAIAHGNEAGKAEATIGNAKVTIVYGRPTLKGRDINKLIQPGQIWRIGADMATTIESDADLDFGGTRVPKGKHVLLAHFIAPGQWTLVVSSEPVNHYAPAAKLAEVPMQVEEQPSVDELSINLASQGGSGTIEIAWGTAKLSASFKPAS